MTTYRPNPTTFEVQSLAFGILRKNLYPGYLIRGNYKFPKLQADIAIFKAHEDKDPTLSLILQVKSSKQGYETAPTSRFEPLTSCPMVFVNGYDDAYKVLQLVSPHL